MSLSIVISAYNEERNIEKCLRSVEGLAEEIIVIDNGSEDKTGEVASKFTSKVFKQDNDPAKIDIQKNYGFEKASKEWILSLDADEQVPKELYDEIKERLENSKENINGYWIPRKNIIFGKWIEHTGWSPDYQLRLFRKGKGKYLAKKVHEPLVVEGETERLDSPIIHDNYQTVNQFIKRLIVYTDSEAKAVIDSDYKFSPMDVVRRPFEEFLRRYFTEEGYKDGLHGLSLSLLMAFYHLVIFLKVWENNKFVEADIDISKSFKQESKKIASEITYWVAEAQKKETKNPFKRLVLRTSQKIASAKSNKIK